MASPRAFARELQVATRGFAPEAIAGLLAKFALETLAEAQSAGEAPETYLRVVNGVEGRPEEAVVPPGPIVYLFSWLPDAAAFALDFARKRSPVQSGKYRDAWFIMVNGSRADDLAGIRPDAEVILVNDVPYARRIEVGKTESGRAFVVQVAPGIAQDTRQAVKARFGNVLATQFRMIPLEGAYVLKVGSPLHGYRRSRGGKSHRAGAEMTYPAVVMTMNFQ